MLTETRVVVRQVREHSAAHEAISAQVRAHMARTGQTQTDVAQALGVTQSKISARLNRRLRWSVEDLDRLSTHFGVPLAELLAPPPDAPGGAFTRRYGHFPLRYPHFPAPAEPELGELAA